MKRFFIQFVTILFLLLFLPITIYASCVQETGKCDPLNAPCCTTNSTNQYLQCQGFNIDTTAEGTSIVTQQGSCKVENPGVNCTTNGDALFAQTDQNVCCHMDGNGNIVQENIFTFMCEVQKPGSTCQDTNGSCTWTGSSANQGHDVCCHQSSSGKSLYCNAKDQSSTGTCQVQPSTSDCVSQKGASCSTKACCPSDSQGELLSCILSNPSDPSSGKCVTTQSVCKNLGGTCSSEAPCCDVDQTTLNPLVCGKQGKCISDCVDKGGKCTGTSTTCCTTGSDGSLLTCNQGKCIDAAAAPPTPTPFPPNPCPSQGGECTSIPTALGTIDVGSPGAFIKTAFGVLLSLSGGIAILLIIFSGYGIMTAQGDAEKLKGAQEMLTSAIIGLLFMIFSVTILQILGVDILHLPGFGK